MNRRRFALQGLLATALGWPIGCQSAEPKPPPPIERASALTMLVQASAEADFWDADPEPDGLLLTLLFSTPESSARVSVDGDVEVALRLDEEAAAPASQPFHRWTFPRERLAAHQHHTDFGWAYIFRLDWGRHIPRPGPATLVVQFRPASAHVPAPAEARHRLLIPTASREER